MKRDHPYDHLAAMIRAQNSEKEDFVFNGLNVHFICVESKTSFKIVTCELAAGVTYACGTGTGASVYCAYKLGLIDDKVDAQTRGGIMNVRVAKNKDGDDEVFIGGECEYVYTGIIKESL